MINKKYILIVLLLFLAFQVARVMRHAPSGDVMVYQSYRQTWGETLARQAVLHASVPGEILVVTLEGEEEDALNLKEVLEGMLTELKEHDGFSAHVVRVSAAPEIFVMTDLPGFSARMLQEVAPQFKGSVALVLLIGPPLFPPSKISLPVIAMADNSQRVANLLVNVSNSAVVLPWPYASPDPLPNETAEERAHRFFRVITRKNRCARSSAVSFGNGSGEA